MTAPTTRPPASDDHEPAATVAPVGDRPRRVRSGRRRTGPRRGEQRLGLLFWVSVAWLAVVALVATLAPWLPIDDPEAIGGDRGLDRALTGPSWGSWFGTDSLARDVFARTVHGARVSLVVGVVAIVLGVVVGGSLGVLAGYFRGALDRLVSFVFVVLLSFPALVLAILITSLVDRGLATISLTLGLLGVAPVGRVARAATIQYAERDFVRAARMIGATHRRIIVHELLPNVAVPMGSLALLGMAVAIVAEGGLAFLGLSVEEGSTWGKLILDGSQTQTLTDAPWVAFAPITVLFLTVLALNLAGDRVRRLADVRTSAL
jgi:peptide/nickel transport system permease protein